MGGSERASLAINAMDALGIPEKRVKPVLKRLLRLYDKNWELIEDENYRVLADAIFDQENDDEEATKNKEIQLDDDSSEPPLKRLRLRSQTDLASGSGETVLKRPKIEKEADLPIARRLRSAVHECISDEDEQETPVSSLALTKVNNEEASQLCLRNRAVRDHVSPQSCFREKGKEPMSSSQICHREETTQNHSHLNDSMDECGNVSSPTQHRLKGMEPSSPRRTSREKGALLPRTTYGSYFKEPKVEPGIILLPREKVPDPRQNNGLIKPKSEPTDDLPAVEVPIAIMAPTNLERSSTEDPIHKDGCSTVSGSTERVNCVDADELLPAKERRDVPGKACGIVTSSELVSVLEAPASFEIASSPLGEVKISINCHQAFERRDFRVPNLDAVLKAVEDKCLRSYRILEPNFSLMKLMEEMCQSFLDLSNKASDPKEDSFLHLTSDFDFLKKSNLRNAFTKSGQNDNIPLSANLSGGSVIESSAGVISAETSKTLLINGLDSHHSLETSGERDMEGSDSSFSNLRSLVVVPQQETAVDVVRPVHDVNDISKGEERVRISLINELSSEPYPPSFYYIPRNIVYQNAYVNFSLARIGDEDCCSNCFGDCLSSSIPCACARETAGEFAYTLEGLVKEKFLNECISMNRDPLKHNRYYCKDCPLERSKEGFSEPCKGHLFRKFIKECWSKCGCSMQCGNRVVQRGITCNLQVFLTSEGKGWGLRTLEELPRGTFICEYVGEILTNMELYDRNMRSTGNEKHTYPVLLDADWGSEGVLKDEEALCLDATYYGNVARFINHKCVDANLVEIPVEVETPDHHYYHLAFFTTRKVDALEELTWDYGIDFDDHNHPVKAFRCRCGSKCCRDMKRSRKIKSRR